MPSVTTLKNDALIFPLRFAAVAGRLGAAILFINAGKRAGRIPLSPFTQLIAPLA